MPPTRNEWKSLVLMFGRTFAFLRLGLQGVCTTRAAGCSEYGSRVFAQQLQPASDPVVILSAARTPLGRFMGELSPLSAHKLGSHVIGAALERQPPRSVRGVRVPLSLPQAQ